MTEEQFDEQFREQVIEPVVEHSATQVPEPPKEKAVKQAARRDRITRAIIVITLSVLVAVALSLTREERSAQRYLTLTAEPQGIMGTSCSLSSVVLPGGESRAESALSEAETVIRQIELVMSSWLEESEISRFNRAGSGVVVRLSPESLLVLREAESAYESTGGTFDITVKPLIRLWREAGSRGIPPGEAQIDLARRISGWGLIQILPGGAMKDDPGVEVDLGGIAKGYAIDRAVELMQTAGMDGGMVDLGGDLRVFGTPPGGGLWRIEIRNPSGEGTAGTIMLESGAVCTSGDYSRFIEIGGEHYSHIIDPRTGWPATASVSVTVVAATALEGDIWATALSVTGPDGFEMLPEGIEALLIASMGSELEMHSTPGFEGLLRE